MRGRHEAPTVPIVIEGSAAGAEGRPRRRKSWRAPDSTQYFPPCMRSTCSRWARRGRSTRPSCPGGEGWEGPPYARVGVAWCAASKMYVVLVSSAEPGLGLRPVPKIYRSVASVVAYAAAVRRRPNLDRPIARPNDSKRPRRLRACV